MMKRFIAAVLACFVLASSAAAGAAPKPLEKEITQDLQQFNGRVGVYAKNLKTGKTYKFNQDDVFPAASTSKLIVALATYKYLYPKATPAKRAEYDAAIEPMIRVSDNETFKELLDEADEVKRDAFDRVEKDLRLSRTRIHDEKAFERYSYHSVTTAADMAKVIETIYGEKYISKAQARQLNDHLANTIFQDEIPRYMQTPVLHKVGELDDVLCDVGVIQDGRDPILISFYTSTDDHEYSSDFIASVSAKLYNALRRQ